MGTLLDSIKSKFNSKTDKQALRPRQSDNAIENSTSNTIENGATAAATTQPPCEHPVTTATTAAPSSPQQQQAAKKFRAAEAKSFYSGGSRASTARLAQVEARVLSFLAQVGRRAAAGGRSSLWRQFPTQQAAFDLADREDPSGEWLRVFSVETGGTRKFIATSYVEFWRRYQAVLPQHRHYYEIIRQGYPCHLYLDLEYSVADNPGRDGQATVDAVLSLLRDSYRDKLSLNLEDHWILELDSSTAVKFSRHVVVRAPGAAFASNTHVGWLVKELVARATESRAVDARCALLSVAKGGESGGAETCVIDTGVYSKNRAFRLHLSSKAGKAAALLPTGRFGTAARPAEQLFMACLVCNVPPESRLLRCFDEDSSGAAGGGGMGGGARCKPGIYGGASDGGGQQQRQGVGPSPHPAVDAFIESVVCSQGGGRGGIRTWVVLDDSVLLYNIKGNRFCGNVGREHRSNGVFYVVDLQQAAWYQKCYDPECRGYRSPAMPLPPGLVPASLKAVEEDERKGAAGAVGATGGRADEDEDLMWGGAEEAAGWDEAALLALEAAEAAGNVAG